jgi:hypothetical protein
MRGWSIRWCGRWSRNAATLAAWFERRMFHPMRQLEILGASPRSLSSVSASSPRS